MVAAVPGDLPDFEQIQQAHTVLANNFARLAHLPAVDQGAAIMGRLERMEQRMERMELRMEQMLQQMQQMLGMEARLAERISASNVNSLSRLHNSQLSAPELVLAPLHHPVSNAPIDDFPATPAALTGLPIAAVNTLLTALGESIEGSVTVRRQRIRRAIGLKELAV
ncbi:hypothetical protein B0A55_06248 [Friedmanniomyces simplex]|uniref:Uncharacterized protein n=1 Tax=Friedmanniomyces simplex TaxID=329884 RepID=A0A4U0X310_9PEZI|nr:hypothetical protein B0A55_06248 [Friedmanniomyces simplex]